MGIRVDPNSLAAFGIETVNVVRHQVSPGHGLIRDVNVSLARIHFGEDAATRSTCRPRDPHTPSQAGRVAPGGFGR